MTRTDDELTAPIRTAPTPAVEAVWITVSRSTTTRDDLGRLRPRRLLAQLIVGLIVVLIAVGLIGSLAAKRLAEREAVNDAADRADLFAEAIVQPALSTALVQGDEQAVARMDALMRASVLGPDVVRVKIWDPSGRILYADQPELVGRTFALDEEQREALSAPRTIAEVSNLENEENEFEIGDKLVEVYRPVWMADGTELLFEVYTSYEPVQARSGQLWRGFAGVTVSSMLLLVVLMAPVLWRLVGRVLTAQRHREGLLEHAVAASDDERRRIAAGLHDGPVQELVATSYAVSGAATRADAGGDPALAEELTRLAALVRGNVRVLRSLLVDIYPPSLAAAGLGPALRDLASGQRERRVDTRLELAAPDTLGLSDGQERLVFRVAQECLRNIGKHAAPCTAVLRMYADPGDDTVVFEVADDGPGFDTGLLTDPDPAHFGLRVLIDLATDAGAELSVRSAAGAGTTWRLRLHPDDPSGRTP